MQQHALWIQNFVIRKLGKKILLLHLHKPCNYEWQIVRGYNNRLYANIKTEIRGCKIFSELQCP